MQALDGKIAESDDQAAESEEKTLACKSDWENKDLDWKVRPWATSVWGLKLLVHEALSY